MRRRNAFALLAVVFAVLAACSSTHSSSVDCSSKGACPNDRPLLYRRLRARHGPSATYPLQLTELHGD